MRTIALAQVEAHDLSDASLALEAAQHSIHTAAGTGADLCILPEGTYPGYVLGSASAGRRALASGPDPITTFGATARDSSIEVIVGLVLETEAGLLNAAVHFNGDGEVVARTAKRFLWHFDRAWYVPGSPGTLHDGVGVLVCADGRLPEIAAGLAQDGANLLVNSTAWVVSAPAPAGTNAQAEFLWRVRALETGCAAVACTKVGTEEGVAMYAGKSQVVGHDGTVLAIASPTEPELLVAEVDVPERAQPPVSRPVSVGPPTPPEPRDGHAYVVAVTDERLVPRLEHHGCRLVVGPAGVLSVDQLSTETLVDDDLLVPGPARAAAFRGIEVLVWLARQVSTPYVEAVARTRALENRLFVVCWRPRSDGGPVIIGPSGAVLARAPEGAHHAVGASILPVEAASKEVAPGTDLFAGAVEIGVVDP